ncbi:hypothetical protein SAMN02745121_05754 [Nannocystis exedens]|uniref:Uncharacterized protein n=1 Tax=Nannocystis exedens TaxID=54 RepID=A0A1I2DT14_9BACT|nr:hypothetical protein [Nannocystis exedens]PCC68912.1 hypothetical protein NAEX_01933 [Nannocystis exedens]SFE83772.1 hypothetical protein SAMN02745121_05754 [Nannocystis exedens]
MRLAQVWSMMAVVLAFGGVGLASQTASALCCSAPICQREEPPPPLSCWNCDPECVEEEQMSVIPELVYDEVEGLCYETDGAEAVPCAGADADER